MKSNLVCRVVINTKEMKLPSNLIILNLSREPVNQIIEEVAPADN